MGYLIMCRSLTYAQRAARVLERAGIGAGIIKAPAGLTGNGIDISVFFCGKKSQRMEKIQGIRHGKLPLLPGGEAAVHGGGDGVWN